MQPAKPNPLRALRGVHREGSYIPQPVICAFFDEHRAEIIDYYAAKGFCPDTPVRVVIEDAGVQPLTPRQSENSFRTLGEFQRHLNLIVGDGAQAQPRWDGSVEAGVALVSSVRRFSVLRCAPVLAALLVLDGRWAGDECKHN